MGRLDKYRDFMRIKRVFCAFIILGVIFGFVCQATTLSASITNSRKDNIIDAHPRIFINSYNKAELVNKVRWHLFDAYNLLLKRVRHDRIPKRLNNIKSYIYKCGYLYQITKEEKWAEYAILAMETIPNSIEAYGGANNGYAHALEALAIGFDWCYDLISKLGKKKFFIDLIDNYYKGNISNLTELPDFHNYASQAEFATLAAGLATYGDNPKALRYLELAVGVMEEGKKINGIFFNVKDVIDFVDGSCNWEGSTYGRQQLFSYIKYCEAWRTATNDKVNLWKSKFLNLENAGYYIIYSLRPDNKFENISDVSYPAISYHDINNLAALQGQFKNRYFTAFLDRYYRWHSGKFDTDINLGGARIPLIYYFLWYDPKINGKSLLDLPKSKKFGDVIIMRTGFNSDDTFITFKSGVHWGFHSQLDHGSFTIYKNSPLAIDSGYYDSWRNGRLHNWNFWKRTIAHNTLLIYNKKEKWPGYPKNEKRYNDGGQRMVFRTFLPPHLKTGFTNNPKSAEDITRRLNEFQMGKIVQYEFSNNYDYIKSNLTNAYNNVYSGWGDNQPKKVNSVEREFVYLRPHFIVVFDKIDSTKKSFMKSWLLHSGNYYDKSGKPEFNGNMKVIEGNHQAGIIESRDTDIVTITQGTGKLFVKTLLPEKHITRRVGGKGYEFWVDGKNMNISVNTIPKERLAENPGAWRIEIQPQTKQKYDEFLNVLYPCESNISEMPEIVKIVTDLGNTSGVHIKDKKKNWVIMFNRSKENKELVIRYNVKITANCRHLFFNLKSKTNYEISHVATKKGIEISVRESKNNTGIVSSSEGSFSFTTNVSEKLYGEQ